MNSEIKDPFFIKFWRANQYYALYVGLEVVIPEIFLLCLMEFMKRFPTSKIWHCMKSHHAFPIGRPNPLCFAAIIFSSNLCTMVNKAKSKELKNQIFRKEVDDLKAYAANIYIAE